jgi:aryl-alcohol dehydrogenase-like predicted oxidoreductase
MRAGDSVVPEAKKHNIAVIAREPFASGSLLSDNSKAEHQSAALGCATTQTLAQAALQEVLKLSGVSVVVVGMSSRVHLRENLGALEIR